MTEDELRKQATLERYKVDIGVVWLNREPYPYYITNQDMPELENGIVLKEHLGYWGMGLLFISEAIPEKYRKHMLRHELRENLELGGINNPGACLQASEQELKHIPDDIIEEYAAYRTRQFQRLLELFCSETESVFTANLKASFAFWKKVTTSGISNAV